MSRDAIERLLRKHVATAGTTSATLRGKNVSPHVLRHSAAMALLQNGVDLSVIALWLGHETTRTVQAYLHADMTIKQRGRHKVRRYLRADNIETLLVGGVRSSVLDSFKPYLHARLATGHGNTTLLLGEITEQGDTGGYNTPPPLPAAATPHRGGRGRGAARTAGGAAGRWVDHRSTGASRPDRR